jgi:hypothetical protein
VGTGRRRCGTRADGTVACCDIGRVSRPAHHLHEVEQAGEVPETPFIALLGVVLFVLPVFLVIVGLAFAAYYLAG